MADDLKSSNLVNNGAIVAALLSASALLFNQYAPLKDARPESREPQIHETSTKQFVDARLWQDPFAVIAKEMAEEAKKKNCEDLTAPCFKPAPEIDASTHVLGVMASAAPYAEEEETRRRLRYAVVSALHAEGFHPDDDRHIGYFTPPERLDLPKAVPYERFVDDAHDKKVLVLWLNEDRFKLEPLKGLEALLGRIENLETMQIIGPRSSDTLRAIAVESGAREPGSCVLSQQYERIGFYAYGATAAQKELFPNAAEGQKAEDLLRQCGVRLMRTIAPDDVLAKALKNELKLRGVEPGAKNHVAVISEWDTFYGRSFPATLKRVFEANPSPFQPEKNANWLHKIGYLRGLDGALPQPAKADSAKSDAPQAAGGGGTGARPGALEERIDELAYGQVQFDYLRRLAGELQAIDAGLRGQGKKLAAIGVVGGDVFDKLLVFRALRPQFPDAIFFTNDFDYLLATRSELKWTRNLLIASSFGPKLRPELQGEVPPFRDAYTTSAFLSTRLAVGDAIGAAKSRNLQAPAVISDVAQPEMLFWRTAERQQVAMGRSAIAGAPIPPKTAPEFLGQTAASEWTNSVRMFEVDRLGDIMALPDGTSKSREPPCEPPLCENIHPAGAKAYRDFPLAFRLVVAAVVAAAAAWMFRSLRATHRALAERKIQSDGVFESSAPKPLTFDAAALWLYRLLCVFVNRPGFSGDRMG